MQAKGWIFTINNPVMPMMDPPLSFNSWRYPPVYAIYQLEVGEQGTPHLQGYVYFAGKRRKTAVKAAFVVNPHLEPRKGFFSFSKIPPLR